MSGRNGSYPPPPFWPERLTHSQSTFRPPWDLTAGLVETDEVLHSYVMDRWPGPCTMLFNQNEFVDWLPALTVDRAIKKAEAS